MPEHYPQIGAAIGAAMTHNARMAARHAAERAAEETEDDRSTVPLGHTIPAHQAFGWCSHCPDRTPAEELAAWQTREAPVSTAENERLRTENGRLRHELEVMYGGAFDRLKDLPAPPPAADGLVLTGHTIDIGWPDDEPLPARLYLAVHPAGYHDPAQLAADLRAAIAGTVPVRAPKES